VRTFCCRFRQFQITISITPPNISSL
jgi:hypothetical protein